MRPGAAARSVVVVACCAALGCGAPRARNVVLITLDTVRADHLGAYGGSPGLTPALDRLAAEGVLFEQATSAAPLTLPSHATILTGLLPHRHGLRVNGGDRLSEAIPTLATSLRSAGYRTGAFVAAAVLDHRFGLARGFDVYDDRILRSARSRGVEAERAGSAVADAALAWVAEPRPEPFLLWVHLYDAHAPYEPPEPFRSRWSTRPYAGEIGFVDSQVGRLLAGLPATTAARTVVAVVADHGEGLGEHGESTHGLLLYQSTLRVPWLLRAAGLTPRRVTEPVSLADVAPTLLGLSDAVDAGALGATDGHDHSRALRSGEAPARAAVFAESRYPESLGWSALVALRRGDWKYVASTSPRADPGAELFDLRQDPGELANLAAARRRESAELRVLVEPLRAEPTTRATGSLDAETRAALASLGYLAPATPPPATGADPRAKAPQFERFQRATRARKGGDLEEASSLLEPLVEQEPDNPVFLAELALVSRERGDARRAAELAGRAVEIAPRDAQAWYNLGMALQATGDFVAGERALRTAIRWDPSDPASHNALGVLEIERGDASAAEGEFAVAVAAEPLNTVYLSNHGNALRAIRRVTEAERAYRQALQVDPAHSDAANGLGALLVETDRAAEGLALFDAVLRERPESPEARLNRAIALELLGRNGEAVAAYLEILNSGSGPGDVRRAAKTRLLVLRGQRPGIDERR
jgi:arylsulfatase A-like enzyme/Flp pilus assembly protein TadD